jgi:hypothetical protein
LFLLHAHAIPPVILVRLSLDVDAAPEPNKEIDTKGIFETFETIEIIETAKLLIFRIAIP